MSDTASVGVTLQYYNSTTQNVAEVNFAPDAYVPVTPAKNGRSRLIAPITSALTLSLAPFTTILAFVAKNKDATNYVEVTYTYTDGIGVDHINVHRIPPGGVWASSSTMKISAGVAFLANTAPVIVDYALVAT